MKPSSMVFHVTLPGGFSIPAQYLRNTCTIPARYLRNTRETAMTKEFQRAAKRAGTLDCMPKTGY